VLICRYDYRIFLVGAGVSVLGVLLGWGLVDRRCRHTNNMCWPREPGLFVVRSAWSHAEVFR
jgi:hypothetical protein